MRPVLALPTARGPRADLGALHDALGRLAGRASGSRRGATIACGAGSLTGGLLRVPALRLRGGWQPRRLRQDDPERRRHPGARWA